MPSHGLPQAAMEAPIASLVQVLDPVPTLHTPQPSFGSHPHRQFPKPHKKAGCEQRRPATWRRSRPSCITCRRPFCLNGWPTTDPPNVMPRMRACSAAAPKLGCCRCKGSSPQTRRLSVRTLTLSRYRFAALIIPVNAQGLARVRSCRPCKMSGRAFFLRGPILAQMTSAALHTSSYRAQHAISRRGAC